MTSEPIEESIEPAIARLREELANFERQASATRALIEALVDRAGATDSVRAKITAPKAPSSGRQHGPTKRAPALERHATTKPAPTSSAAEADGAKELAEITTILARSQRDIEAAIRSKDISRMKMAMTAIARAERRGGEILTELKGKPLPVSLAEADRKRWREAAARSPKAFSVKLRRDLAAAEARISGSVTVGAAAKAPRSHPPAPANLSSRKLQAKLSEWEQAPDGSLSRTLASVGENDVAVAPAGA